MRRSMHNLLGVCPGVCALISIAACASHETPRLTTLAWTAEPPLSAAVVAPTSQPEVTFEPVQPLDLEGSQAYTRDQYNKSYSTPGFQLEPNAFLIQTLNQIAKVREVEQPNPQLKPDPDPTALEIAMGNGRNAIPLVQHGYRTVAFDLSDVGVNLARRKAAELGLGDRLSAVAADAYNYDYGTEEWNIVVMMYFRMTFNYLSKVKDSVKPGGYIIMEFQDTNITNETLAQFMDWTIVHYERDYLPRDWGPGRKYSPGPILRLVARKPKAPPGAPSIIENAGR